MTTGKTIALTIQTFAGKVMSLLFNMLSSFVMGFPGGSEGKESACNTGDLGSVPGTVRFIEMKSRLVGARLGATEDGVSI